MGRTTLSSWGRKVNGCGAPSSWPCLLVWMCVLRAVRRPSHSPPFSSAFPEARLNWYPFEEKQTRNWKMILGQRRTHHFEPPRAQRFYQRQMKYLNGSHGPVGGLIQSGDRFFTACFRVTGSRRSHTFLGISAIWSCAADPAPYPTSSELLLIARLPVLPLPARCHCRYLAFGACACVKCCPDVSQTHWV